MYEISFNVGTYLIHYTFVQLNDKIIFLFDNVVIIKIT